MGEYRAGRAEGENPEPGHVWGWLLQTEGNCVFQLRVHGSRLQHSPVHVHGCLLGRVKLVLPKVNIQRT